VAAVAAAAAAAAIVAIGPAIGPVALLLAVPATLFGVDAGLLLLAVLAPHRPCPPGVEPGAPASGEQAGPAPGPILVPLLVRGEADIDAAERCLRENRALMGAAAAEIVLLVDFRDADTQHAAADAGLRRSLEHMVTWVDRDRAEGVPAAALLLRARVWNPYDRRWMGWERKRGKVVEFLRHTRGLPTGFAGTCPARWRGTATAFVMDVDTRIAGDDLTALATAFAQARACAPPLSRPSVISPVVRTLDLPREPIQRWLNEPWVCAGDRDWRRHTLRTLAFGHDIYNGKALIAVDDFLASSHAIEDNTVLSHDHLEAILGHGQSTPVASVHEPFPATRAAWERRQHRWMRGDFQVLPWIFRRRAAADRAPLGPPPPSTPPSTLTPGQRAAIAHVVLDAVNPVALYVPILAGLVVDPPAGCAVAAALLLIHRGGVPLAVARLPLFTADSRAGWRRALRFLATNAALRTLGTLVYLQRDALITADALRLSLARLARGDRRGLLEWYPDDPERPLRTRRLAELALIAGSAALCWAGIVGAAVPAAIAGWAILPPVLDRIAVRRTRPVAVRF